MNIILTIGVPVFNGEHCIEKTLSSIANELHKSEYSDKIEILIGNNGSTDKTEEIIDNISDINPTYYKNEANYGFDANIEKLVELAQGEYVWFLGCNDTLKGGCLDLLIKKILFYKANIFIANYEIFDEGLDCIVNEKVYQYGFDIVSNDINKDIRYPRYSATLSADIIKKHDWIANKKKSVGDLWLHIERLLSIQTNNNCSLIILDDIFFVMNREADGWWKDPDSHTRILEHINILQNAQKLGLSKKTSNNLLNNICYMPLLHSVILVKKIGVITNKELLLKYVRVKKPFFIFLVIIPTIYMPRYFVFIPELLMNLILSAKRLTKKYLK